MENFEYSIQLNNRDWAEFCLASEECSLSQPALATVDEQLLSDLEEGEAEENRSIQMRAGPILAHDTTSRLSHGHPLVEEVWPGSKDEFSLGSVSRPLCSSNQGGTASSQSSQTQDGQLPCGTSRPLRSQCGLPGPATDYETVFAVKEGELERGDRPINPNHLLPVVVAPAVQEKDFSDHSPGLGTVERPACAVHMNLDATVRMDNPVGENESQHPKDDIAQAASVDFQFPTSAEGTAVSDQLEASSDLAAYPSPVHFSSPVSTEPGGAGHLEKGTKPLQTVLLTQATPFQEKPPLFHGHSGPVVRDLAPSGPLLEKCGESSPGKGSKKGENATNLRVEREAGCDILKEGGQDGQLGSSSSNSVVQQFPGELRPTQASDSRYDRTLDTHREPAALAGRAKKKGTEEPHHHLGMAVPLQEDSHTVLQAGQRSNFSGESIPSHLTLRDSPESNLTTMTWPDMYDYFFCDDTQEKGGKTGEGIGADEELPQMDGPEMYEYFFSDVGEAKVKEGCGDKTTALETLVSSDHMSVPPSGLEDLDSTAAGDAMHFSVPEVYEHFFANHAKGKRNWRAFFLSMPASEAKKIVSALKSLLCRPTHHFRCQPEMHGALLRRGSQGRLVLLSPGLLDERQPRPGDLRMAVMEPERPLQPVFTHRDMCLGFMAFASWAVKTSDLQAPDAWKIVLLANFGTFSAIRYFRRQVITERQHET